MADDAASHRVRNVIVITGLVAIGGALLYTCGFRKLRQSQLEKTLRVFEDPTDAENHIPYRGLIEQLDPAILVAATDFVEADREDGMTGEAFHTRITMRFGGQTITIVTPEIVTHQHYLDTVAVLTRLFIARLEQRTTIPMTAYHRRSIYQHLQVLLDDDRL